MRYILLATALTACTTTEPARPVREGGEVKCAQLANGPATEVCVYPLGVLCFGGDKGLSCVQPLPMAGGVQ